MKYKLVLDVSEDGIWNVDVRHAGVTIGHILLSPTGVSWKDPHGRDAVAAEIPWDSVKNRLF